MTETSSGLIDGTVIAAVVTGLVALLVLAGNQYQARKDRLRKDFAEALAAVERYAELPYRILRRQDSTPEVRGHIAELVHEVQQDILFHKRWVRIQSSEVAEVYDALLEQFAMSLDYMAPCAHGRLLRRSQKEDSGSRTPARHGQERGCSHLRGESFLGQTLRQSSSRRTLALSGEGTRQATEAL